MKNLIITRNSFLRRKRPNKSFKDFNFILWIIPSILFLLGGILIASIQRQVELSNWNPHLITGLIGIAIAFFVAQSPVDLIRKYLSPIYFLTILSLIAVLLFGTEAFGAQRWLSIGGINIQPSEIAKLTSILVLAGILDRNEFDNPSKLIKPLLVIFIPWILVFIQPDLGTSLVFGAVLLVMMYWSGMPFEWGLIFLSGIFTAIFSGVFKIILFLWIPFLGFLAYRSLPKKRLISLLVMLSQIAIAWMTPWLWTYALQDYQKDRLTLFLDPGKDPLGGGYHLIQSQIGIGSGHLLGTGLLQGQLTRLNFIPEQHTDFIFSALGEETGFLGTIFVVVSFSLLILRLLAIARTARTDFESLVVVGIASMFMFQVIVNVFMNIGLGPVTGIPLPFMSYGRTALIVNFISIGLCISVARRSLSLSKSL
ncbi:rod shape-determining protein RodA [Prochlorococcus sp. MIT 1223]|uniref:rod shape-determining protein RodA n=1 Tax=Prochlorococcus sp. MIT 1223 TaxID=3096217 RepID=UPI002A75B9A0|nr:rod shape-determining protein RodA [Prochlorococcus sp. MIT 1223]